MQINRDCPNCGARSAVYLGNWSPGAFIVGEWSCGACNTKFELTKEEIKMARDEAGNPVPDNHGIMPGDEKEVLEGTPNADAPFSEKVFPPDVPTGANINVTANEVNITEDKSDDNKTAADATVETVGDPNPVQDVENDNVATRRGRPRSK